MAVSEATYRRVALEDPEERWELVCGRLRSKPPMTMQHNWVPSQLAAQLHAQLPPGTYIISEVKKLRTQSGSYFNPDLAVIPREDVLAQPRDQLEIHEQPVPFVLERWSPSTGSTDLTAKLPEYQARGDAEIWLLHPVERTLDIRRRLPDGSYAQFRHTAGPIPIVSLPGVLIDFEALFV